ncbi:unnamed protein product [Musa acuminata subsp. malaccensis]|uniref:(wild Malaysian banana) hypothetical protein n=1 Tax=Musa acuminata subsp. malaccensis TaxID=214687 RepID=A0A804J076_MUSAM|nr:unnamed protein product [Musa acuminata subsp. malaccensis]
MIQHSHTVHPISAVRIEWSLWSQDIEEEIIPVCREFDIGIVPYGPIGHGFLASKGVAESLPQYSYPNWHPRFTGENLEKNKRLLED